MDQISELTFDQVNLLMDVWSGRRDKEREKKIKPPTKDAIKSIAQKFNLKKTK